MVDATWLGPLYCETVCKAATQTNWKIDQNLTPLLPVTEVSTETDGSKEVVEKVVDRVVKGVVVTDPG